MTLSVQLYNRHGKKTYDTAYTAVSESIRCENIYQYNTGVIQRYNYINLIIVKQQIRNNNTDTLCSTQNASIEKVFPIVSIIKT